MSDNMTRPEWIDPDDAPELDDDWFARAELRDGDRVLRAARPEMVTLSLPPAVVSAFRVRGPDWQARMAEVLERATGV